MFCPGKNLVAELALVRGRSGLLLGWVIYLRYCDSCVLLFEIVWTHRFFLSGVYSDAVVISFPSVEASQRKNELSPDLAPETANKDAGKGKE